MEQLILLLLFGGIALIQWLVKKSAEARAQRKREQQSQWQEEPEVFQEAREFEPPPPAEDPDASMRKLMEALGLPQEAAPPPVPRREVVPPPVPRREVTPPPIPQPPVLVVPERSPQRLPERSIAKLPERPPTPAAKRAAAKPFPSEPVPEQPATLSIRELLASPDSLKKAVILSELLGAPKALKP